MRRTLLGVFAALLLAPPAAAGEWLPHPPNATWTYEWRDSVYSPTPTKEKVTVKEQKGASFALAWTTEEQGNPEDAVVSIGTMVFQETNHGLVNAGWSNSLPPASFPILCAQPSGCNNSLASALHNVIWGSRVPVLAEPLLRGATWAGTGGAQDDVASSSEYLGVERVTVPAFPGPVPAAKVRSEISQAGALGDPYGSGVRTVWWVYGVGPVRAVFEHSGGGNAPLTTVVLTSTNLTPKPPPSDVNYFPLRRGLTTTYRWTNTRHLKKASVTRFTVDQVVNESARVVARHVSGPIRVGGAYTFTLRLDGLTNLAGFTRAATLVKFPPLGPARLAPAKRRRFFTPYDLMTYGFNPLLPAYADPGKTWRARRSGRDFALYGVTGTTRVLGVQTVRVPAGTFQAVAVRSTLKQPGFPFGSGTRTSWFAPGKGLVKLVFRHGDGSVSNVDLLR